MNRPTKRASRHQSTWAIRSRVRIRRLVSTNPAIPKAVSGAGTGERKRAMAATVRSTALAARGEEGDRTQHGEARAVERQPRDAPEGEPGVGDREEDQGEERRMPHARGIMSWGARSGAPHMARRDGA